MSDITEFLLARIAEDEAAANAVEPLGHVYDMGGNRTDDHFGHVRWSTYSMDGMPYHKTDHDAPGHFSRWDPARVLAECSAKRQIVEMHEPFDRVFFNRETDQMDSAGMACGSCLTDEGYESTHEPMPCKPLRLLAAIDASHPDYDASWAL